MSKGWILSITNPSAIKVPSSWAGQFHNTNTQIMYRKLYSSLAFLPGIQTNKFSYKNSVSLIQNSTDHNSMLSDWPAQTYLCNLLSVIKRIVQFCLFFFSLVLFKISYARCLVIKLLSRGGYTVHGCFELQQNPHSSSAANTTKAHRTVSCHSSPIPS